MTITKLFPFSPHEMSVLVELTLRHLRYHFTDPPQPLHLSAVPTNRSLIGTCVQAKTCCDVGFGLTHRVGLESSKLNRVFFPR